MSATIYRQEIVDRAKEHREAGWSLDDVARHLRREFGHAPSRTTISTWTDPAYAERRRKLIREGERRRYVPTGRKTISPELRLERMVQLRDAGATFSSIAIVSGVLWGHPLSTEQARYQIRRALEGRT